MAKKHGRYKIVRKVADGGMAEIFLATQIGREGFQKPVILKRIHSTIYADPQFRNMFIDEAHISMGLSHSNIVQILDLGVGNGRYFLVMEVVDGWDLGRVLARAHAAGTPLPRELGLYVTAEVCRALAYAHGKTDLVSGRPLGIVHRDVSPQNILLSEQGEVKLTDFGIAKAMGKREQTGTGVVKGKVAFMSPEQALGKAIDARSDLFAVGTVLYQLMVGVRPFEAPTDLEILLRVQKADFRAAHEVARDLPAQVGAIIARSMQLEPDLRYQSADEMLTDIEQVMRTVFQPVGQTELKRWLAALSARDGQVPMAKGAPAHTPTPGRAPGTGEMEGKDVELDDVDGEEATSLASLDGPGGEMRQRMTRPRGAEMALPVPQDDEAGLSGRMSPLEFPSSLASEGDQRPGRRSARRSGGMGFVFLGLLLVGGAAFGGRYFGLLREKASGGEAGPAAPKPVAAAADVDEEAVKPKPKLEAKAAKSADDERSAATVKADAGARPEGHLASRKTGEGEHEAPPRHGHGAPDKPEHLRRIDEIKGMMAPDPSLDPAPAPPPSAPPPAPVPAPVPPTDNP
ncbi:MAG TPA: serine/threonine-protein kinase [Polyangia bacterium]|jgi:serine/threonine-protein kinase|nr:serine/threonine-protein kinase [Polyangia bacterium]